jgi:UDP-N-acetylglucosamine--N-acetylmuramyl-(pentapeptide) pyrophosphoryl-undecaprenol N-acetylglucosamine transferase
MLGKLKEQLPNDLQRRYQVVEFVREEIADVYAAASLVLGRAGAGTVAELAYLGKPSILIPLPGAGGDEQRVNANVLRRTGGAIVIDQDEATTERLECELNRLACDEAELSKMAANAKSIAKPDAASKLTDLILETARQDHV